MSTRKEAKTVILSARVPQEIKEAADQAARDDHRTVASLLTKIMAEWLEQHGYIKGKPKPKR